jgi:hypothetical protein
MATVGEPAAVGRVYADGMSLGPYPLDAAFGGQDLRLRDVGALQCEAGELTLGDALRTAVDERRCLRIRRGRQRERRQSDGRDRGACCEKGVPRDENFTEETSWGEVNVRP